jgi:hypothetical protein
MRGRMENCAVLLGSATPSLESWHNAKTGKYRLAVLPERADGRKMPIMHVIDMRVEAAKTDPSRRCFFSIAGASPRRWSVPSAAMLPTAISAAWHSPITAPWRNYAATSAARQSQCPDHVRSAMIPRSSLPVQARSALRV